MSKYKIHIDPPLPDSKKIQGYKDFDALYDHYQVNTRFNFWRNLYRRPTSFAVLVLVIAIGALVFDASKDDVKQEMDYFLKAPTVGLMPDANKLELEADSQGQFVGSDWKINVPPGIFMDTLGNEVIGEAEIYYRWLPSAADWLKRGLPLQDKSTIYASKGVLEIFAKKGKKSLKMMPGEALTLTVPYPDGANGFLPMKLDTQTRTWTYIKDTTWVQLWDSSGLSSIQARPVMDSSDLELVAKASSKKLKAPPRPFGVEVENKDQYPYFKDYEKVYWEYLDLPGSANPWKEKLLGKENGWSQVNIRRTSKTRFTLTFSKVLPDGAIVRKRVIAKPLFKASNKAEAEAIYQEKLKEYKEALAKIEQEKQEALKQRKAAYQKSLKAWEAKKQVGVVSKGSLCLIRLHQLGFVGLMQPVEGNAIPKPTEAEEAQRLWWSDPKGEKLVEILPGSEQKLPEAESPHWYKLVDGTLVAPN